MLGKGAAGVWSGAWCWLERLVSERSSDRGTVELVEDLPGPITIIDGPGRRIGGNAGLSQPGLVDTTFVRVELPVPFGDRQPGADNLLKLNVGHGFGDRCGDFPGPRLGLHRQGVLNV